MEHLPQSLGSLRIEGSVNGMRALRVLLERLFETLIVELVDGIAHGLRVTTERASYPIGVLAPIAGEQDLAAAEDESIGRAQTRLQGFAFGLAQGTHVYWSSHAPRINY